MLRLKCRKNNKLLLFDQNEKAKAGDQLLRAHSSESSVVWHLKRLWGFLWKSCKISTNKTHKFIKKFYETIISNLNFTFTNFWCDSAHKIVGFITLLNTKIGKM